jgi:protein-tyrosine phosphatase
LADLYPLRTVPGVSLVLMARPRAGDWLEDEISAWSDHGIRTVVSLLETSEIEELDLGREPELCATKCIDFISFPIPDRGVPSPSANFEKLVHAVVTRIRAGTTVAIHCRAGIGRTGLVSACVLVRLGLPFDQVFPMLSEARRVAVPDTDAQIKWVRQFAEAGT